MRIETALLNDGDWQIKNPLQNVEEVNLVTVFGDTEVFADPKHYEYLRSRYPNADIVGCSSAGNIHGESISSSALVVTAVCLENSKAVLNSIDFELSEDIKVKAKELAESFDQEGLELLFILSDGLNLNGSDLDRKSNV